MPSSSSFAAVGWWPYAAGTASFVAFWQFQRRVAPRLSAALFPAAYCSARLTPTQRLEWDSRVTSTVHAIFACLMWILCWTLRPPGLFDDPHGVGGSSWLSCAAFISMAGYMISDALGMLAYGKTWAEMAPFQLHHLLAAVGFISCAKHGTLHYFVMYRVASEFSTPMVNFLWFFRVSGYRRVAPLVNIANSIALTLAFTCCRVLPIPIYWLRLVAFLTSAKGFTYLARFPVIGSFWFVYSLGLDILNLYWFRRLIIGGLKLMRGEDGAAASAATRNGGAVGAGSGSRGEGNGVGARSRTD